MPSTEWIVTLSTTKLSKSIALLPEHVRLKIFAPIKGFRIQRANATWVAEFQQTWR